MIRPSREKIIISSRNVEPQNQDNTQSPTALLKNRWRTTRVGFTPLGGLLAIGCLMIVVMAPKFLSDFFVSGFWNNAYGTTRYMLFSDFIGWAILDQDYGYLGSYAIGTVMAILSFYCASQILEFLGYLVFREGDN